MTPDLYRQVGEIFRAALEVPPEQRTAFLESACSGNPDLQQNVESLLAHGPEQGPSQIKLP